MRRERRRNRGILAQDSLQSSQPQLEDGSVYRQTVAHQCQHRYLRICVSLSSNGHLRYGVVASYPTISFFRSLLNISDRTNPV